MDHITGLCFIPPSINPSILCEQVKDSSFDLGCSFTLMPPVDVLFWLCCNPHNTSLKCCHYIQSRICCLCCGQLFVVLHNTLSTATFEAPSREQCLWQHLHKFLMCQIRCPFAAGWLACVPSNSRAAVCPVESWQNGMSSSVLVPSYETFLTIRTPEHLFM